MVLVTNVVSVIIVIIVVVVVAVVVIFVVFVAVNFAAVVDFSLKKKERNRVPSIFL